MRVHSQRLGTPIGDTKTSGCRVVCKSLYVEGVASGVIMLTWPTGADQFASAKLLVDQLGVGKRISEGGPKVFLTRLGWLGC